MVFQSGTITVDSTYCVLRNILKFTISSIALLVAKVNNMLKTYEMNRIWIDTLIQNIFVIQDESGKSLLTVAVLQVASKMIAI